MKTRLVALDPNLDIRFDYKGGIYSFDPNGRSANRLIACLDSEGKPVMLPARASVEVATEKTVNPEEIWVEVLDDEPAYTPDTDSDEEAEISPNWRDLPADEETEDN